MPALALMPPVSLHRTHRERLTGGEALARVIPCPADTARRLSQAHLTSCRKVRSRCREPVTGSVPELNATTMVAPAPRRNTMAKYLLLKHYRGAPAAVNDVPMDQWTPEEISAHMQYMDDFAARLQGTGEFVDGQALAPEGMFVRYDGEGRPPVTDGPFAETKDLIAGWMVIDVARHERAIELAGDLSAAPGAGGQPIHEWLEVRPFLAAPPTIRE